MLRRRLAKGSSDDRDVLVFAGPGAGKTLGALLAYRSMKQQGLLNHLVVMCHRTSIQAQWKRAAAQLEINLQEWPHEETDVVGAEGLLVTYQGAGRQLQRLKQALELWDLNRCMAIADEAHHLGVSPDEPETPAWGQTFQQISGSLRLRLGLTGTPFRADNLAFCSARRIRRLQDGVPIEQIVPDLCVEPRELISAGDVRPLEFHFQDGWVEHSREGLPDRDVSPLSSEQRESWRARNLRRAIRLADSSSIGQQVLLKAQQKLNSIRTKHPGAAGLVIARDINHAASIARMLQEDGNTVDLVHSQDKDATQRLHDFQLGQAQWLVSIDMCSEGFDAPRLRVVAYMTTVVTKSRFLQGITRAVRMTPSLAQNEPVPRHPSYVFAPADPLLMQYAQSWASAEPYVIRPQHNQDEDLPAPAASWRGLSLPLEAINDGASEVIQLKAPELPSFLQR